MAGTRGIKWSLWLSRYFCHWGGLVNTSELQEIPVETREQSGVLCFHSRWMPVSPGVSGMQPRDPCRPWRGTLASGWFTDLTFQVPVQYCSLQHRTLLSPPDTSTTGRCFCFGSASSFLLELFFCSSPVAYWAPADLGSVISYRFFILFMGFSR